MEQQHIAVALSGGGHRAALFGLGAMLYLIDANKGPEIATVSSVSGGSITNGWMADTSDLTTVAAEDFEAMASTYAQRIARGGTLWATWTTYAFLLVIAVVFLVAGLLVWLTNAAMAWFVVAGALLLVGVIVGQRSRFVRHAFDSVLFGERKLSEINSPVTHVVCATDLQTAEQVYFSPEFVYSYRTGVGEPADLRLSVSVQASACLPGAFNPVSIPLERHRFPKKPGFGRFLLTDGGAYDNMATEWILRVRQGFKHPEPERTLAVNEAIVVNSSAPFDVVDRRLVRWPILGEVQSLLAVKDVLYDQTTATRRRHLNSLFVTDPDLDGAMMQIHRSPYELPESFIPSDDLAESSEGEQGEDELADRARAVVTLLEKSGSRNQWATIAEASAATETTLSRIDRDRARSLVRHAYTLTMANCHVLLDYPLLDVPDDERTGRWVTG